jgi:hypothetical protein
LNRELHILELWERALSCSGFEREDALLADHSSERRLGERNILMLQLRSKLFGQTWPLMASCPSCASNNEFAIELPGLIRDLADAKAMPGARAVVVEDVRAVSVFSEDGEVKQALLKRCLPGLNEVEKLEESLVPALALKLEEANPAAVISFKMVCPECNHACSAPIDVGDALWREVERAAERSLTEISALARVFGWTETDIMALSATRRAAYLQMAEAG